MSSRSSTVLTLTMLIVAVGTLTAGEAYSSEKMSKVEMAATAKVTIDEAIKTASEKVSGKVIEAELERKHDKLVWEVEVVTAENRVMEVHIDAATGAVIDVEEEKAKPKKFHKRS